MRFLQAVSWRCPRCGWCNYYVPCDEDVAYCEVCRRPEAVGPRREELEKDPLPPEPAV